MGLSEDWKKAKNRLEIMMSKRNPSEPFLEIFRHSHAVETASQRADAAQSASELRAALDEFQKEAAAYTQSLRIAAADAESVPPEDKPTYLSNIEAFENVLAKLVTTGEQKAASLDGTDQVVKVEADPKTVVGQLMGVNKELIALGVWMTKKLATLTVNLEKQKAMLAAQQGPKENMARGLAMMRDAELKACEAVEAKARNLAELEKQVSNIPMGLHHDPEVTPPLTLFVETAARAKTDLASVQLTQQAYIDFLNDSIVMMS